MKPFSVATLAIAVCLASTAVLHSGSDDDRRRESEGRPGFAFALIGDMPYGAEGDAKFPHVIADINADRTLSFVVHDGDFKNGSSVCSDIVFQERLALFNQFARPLIFVPGDNEWTDCHRANNGAYDPLERLTLLRSMFSRQIGVWESAR